MEHRDATLTAEEFNAEIDEAFRLGSTGPRFCGRPYVGLASCQRLGTHEGEHVTKGLSGRLIAF